MVEASGGVTSQEQETEEAEAGRDARLRAEAQVRAERGGDDDPDTGAGG